MILMWHHPKYYKELKRIAKEEADKRASERASKRSSVRGASKQAALNMIPIIHCEGRCFAVIKQKTLERGALIQLYTFEGRYLYEYKVTFCTSVMK